MHRVPLLKAEDRQNDDGIPMDSYNRARSPTSRYRSSTQAVGYNSQSPTVIVVEDHDDARDSPLPHKSRRPSLFLPSKPKLNSSPNFSRFRGSPSVQMDMLDVPGADGGSRNRSSSQAIGFYDPTTNNPAIIVEDEGSLPPMSRGPSIYIANSNKRTKPNINRYRSFNQNVYNYQSMRMKSQLRRMQSQKLNRDMQGRGSDRRSPSTIDPVYLDAEAVDDLIAAGNRSRLQTQISITSQPGKQYTRNFVNLPFNRIHEAYAWEDQELSRTGKFLEKMHLGILPCCQADNESFGHHVSIFLVVFLAFATFLACTIILILVLCGV